MNDELKAACPTVHRSAFPVHRFKGGLKVEQGSGVLKKGADFARLLRVVAYVLAAVAAALLYVRRTDLAFFAAALGASAWFLNVRAGIKRKHDLVKDGARNWRPRAEVEERDTEDDDEE
jgi:hypothetical protein